MTWIVALVMIGLFGMCVVLGAAATKTKQEKLEEDNEQMTYIRDYNIRKGWKK